MTLLLHLVQHAAFGYTEATFLTGVQRATYLRRVLAVGVGGLLVGVGWWAHRRRTDPPAVSVTAALRQPIPQLPILATFTDAALQIVAVGVGGSLGREGAPRQTGAALGGWAASRFGLPAAQRRTVLACGAGAGLAAVYNVPLGGAAFTLEILLASAALADVVAAVLSAGVATVVAWPVLHNHITYPIPAVHYSNPILAWAVLLGPVAGVLGVLFTRLTNTAARHAPTGWRAVLLTTTTFTALGAAATVYPQLLGNGKGPAGLAFTGTLGISLAAAILVLKPVATAACLRAGATGGLLTPALATGAVLGVLTGQLWNHIWPGGNDAQYAIIGAAALLGATQRAPLTAILLTLEFTGTGQALLAPVSIAVGLALTVTHALTRQLTPR
ncbi:chloride channel protein [Allobranchiibius sp. GilTou38]|uniref:chloride channel protein n=1 Tax=Allobranchiibius sp. GilTou38 TaxID=2815210 RepID=UPI001AA145CE|nr:chloride channel protein [Allobranchiibius sp. GilTou38]MBO1766676.1 chloride channel protein [Allobranchiibius sp. GilTou38]